MREFGQELGLLVVDKVLKRSWGSDLEARKSGHRLDLVTGTDNENNVGSWAMSKTRAYRLCFDLVTNRPQRSNGGHFLRVR
jgi:hypothetical protein